MRSTMVCEIGLSNPFFRIVRLGDEADTDLDMDWNYREKIKSLDSGKLQTRITFLKKKKVIESRKWLSLNLFNWSFTQNHQTSHLL